MLKFVNINLMISGSWSGWILLNSPKRVERVGLVQFLCCENWLLAEILVNSCFKLVFVFNLMEFQSMTVLGINEYFRQFLFVAIWINWLCVDKWRTGRRIVYVGVTRRSHRAWCKMETLLTFLLSSNDSHSGSFFHFCDAAPTFIVACYETSTRVSKWSYQHLILKPNTWLSLTKEGVPTGPIPQFFVGL